MADIRAGILSPEEVHDIYERINRLERSLLPNTRSPRRSPIEPQPIYFINNAGETIPSHACMQVFGAVEIDGQNYLQVMRPSDVYGKNGWYVFNGFNPVLLSNEFGVCDAGPLVRCLGQIEGAKRYSPIIDSWQLEERCDGIFIGTGPNHGISGGVGKVFINWAPPDEVTVKSVHSFQRCQMTVKPIKIKTLKCGEEDDSPGLLETIPFPGCFEYPPPDDDYCGPCLLNYETASSPTVSTWCQIGTSSGTAVWAGCDSIAGTPPSDLDRAGFPPDPRCEERRGCNGSYECNTVCDDGSECYENGECVFVTLSNADASEPPDLTPPTAQDGSGGGWSVMFYHSETIDNAGEGSACHVHYWNFKFCGSSGALTTYLAELNTWGASQGTWGETIGQPASCSPSDLATHRASKEGCAPPNDDEADHTTVVLFEMTQPGCCPGDEGTGGGAGEDVSDGCCGGGPCRFKVSPQGADLTNISDIIIKDPATGYTYSGGAASVMDVVLVSRNPTVYASGCRWFIDSADRVGPPGGAELADLVIVYEGAQALFMVTAIHANGSTLDLGKFGAAAGLCEGVMTRIGDPNSKFTLTGGEFCV